jgi:hypothetical protein
MINLSPEGLAVVEAYIQNGQNLESTALALSLPKDEVHRLLNKEESRNYLNQIYYESGFRNRQKMGDLMDEIINAKLEEMVDTGMGSSKDIVEILQAAHSFKMKEMEMEIKMIAAQKTSSPAIQINQQINGGNNYNALLDKLTKGRV